MTQDLLLSPTALGIVVCLALAVLVYRQIYLEPDDKPKCHYVDSPLAQFVLSRCERMKSTFAPAFFARNAHVQTILGSLLPDADVSFHREYVTLNDHGVLALDWAKLETSSSCSPILVVLPGLAGDAQGMSHVCKLAMERGYRPVVFNKRGHGGSKLTTPWLQSFGDPTDLRQVMVHLKESYPQSRLNAVGYSAGSGLLAAYLGEYGSSCLLEAAAFVSPGYQLEYLFKHCIKHPYNFILMRNLKKILKSHADILSGAIDVDRAMRSKNLAEFEEHLYCKLYNRHTMSEHWEINDPVRNYDNLSIPVMVLSSLDDPVCRKDCIIYSLFTEKPNAMLLTTNRGGHCGFLEGTTFERWADKISLDYLSAVADFMDMQIADNTSA